MGEESKIEFVRSRNVIVFTQWLWLVGINVPTLHVLKSYIYGIMVNCYMLHIYIEPELCIDSKILIWLKHTTNLSCHEKRVKIML